MPVRTCPTCAQEVAENSDRCPNCNANLSPTTASTVPPAGTSEATVKMDTAPGVSPTPQAPATPNPTATLQPQATLTDPNSYTAQTNVILPSFKETAERFSNLADRAQFYSTRVLIVCAVLLVVSVVYISRPVEPPRPLPAGVATLLPPNPVSSQSAQTTGDTSATPPPAPTATPGSDIAAYLTFLQKIDLQRIGLVSGLNQALAAATSTATTTQDSFSQPAQDLMRDFLAQKPPTECGDLSNMYYRLLQDQTGMIAKCGAQLQSSDPRSASGIHDSALPQITADAQAADASLMQFCGMQHIDKPFTVQAEPGAAAQPTATPYPTSPAVSPTPAAPNAPPQTAQPPTH